MMALKKDFSLETLSSADEIELKRLTEKYPWFQTGWLMYQRSLEIIGSPLVEEVSRKVAVVVPMQKMVSDFVKFETSKEPQLFANSPREIVYFTENSIAQQAENTLIDRFLSKSADGFRLKVEQTAEKSPDFVSPEVHSNEESDEFVTEMLAKIFFDQKKYEKALAAYKKLSLKYPEKSIYFASQIEKIEKLKDNNS